MKAKQSLVPLKPLINTGGSDNSSTLVTHSPIHCALDSIPAAPTGPSILGCGVEGVCVCGGGGGVQYQTSAKCTR